MASEQTRPREPIGNQGRAGQAGFCNYKYSLLIIIGAHRRPSLVEYVMLEIERGMSVLFKDMCMLVQWAMMYVSLYVTFG